MPRQGRVSGPRVGGWGPHGLRRGRQCQSERSPVQLRRGPARPAGVQLPRGSVAEQPVSSAARFSRYRTVLGCTKIARALASRLPPLLSTARTVSSTSPPAACSGHGHPLVQLRRGPAGRRPGPARRAARRPRTGRGASGQAAAARRPASAAAADSPAWPSAVDDRAERRPGRRRTRRSPGRRPRSRSVAPPRTTTSWSACTPTSTSLRSDRAARRTAACGVVDARRGRRRRAPRPASSSPSPARRPGRTARRTARRAPGRRRPAPPAARPTRRGSRRSWRRRARWRRRPRG